MMARCKFKWPLFFIMSTLLVSVELAAEGGDSSESEARKVVMFSSTYCPACGKAKTFFNQNQIPFLEFDIEKSSAARDYFERLGGRGTPFLLINNRRMQGFSERRFWDYYSLNTPSN